MESYKFSLALLALLLLLPLSAAEVEITANEESNILFVDSGEKVIFRAFGTENSSSILWDFGFFKVISSSLFYFHQSSHRSPAGCLFPLCRTN